MSEPAAALQRCPHCGSTEWAPDPVANRCARCGLTYEQAEREAAHHRRQLEHQRRAELVIEATRGMPMQRRIRAAKYLLLTCGPLPGGEPWDAAFRGWQQAGSP